MKSERLKKFEKELNDLEQWLQLGLVPKKDVIKHKVEIKTLKKKISDEFERLRQIKENGEGEEYVTPKRGARQAYQEPQTMPGVEMESEGMTETGLEVESEAEETEEATTSGIEEGEEGAVVEEDEEDPYSDKNRWRRGIFQDPDSDQW